MFFIFESMVLDTGKSDNLPSSYPKVPLFKHLKLQKCYIDYAFLKVELFAMKPANQKQVPEAE